MEKIWCSNQQQIQDETKDLGGLGNNQPNNQIFGCMGRVKTGGCCKQEINRKSKNGGSENEEADKQHFGITGK